MHDFYFFSHCCIGGLILLKDLSTSSTNEFFPLSYSKTAAVQVYNFNFSACL